MHRSICVDQETDIMYWLGGKNVSCFIVLLTFYMALYCFMLSCDKGFTIRKVGSGKLLTLTFTGKNLGQCISANPVMHYHSADQLKSFNCMQRANL